MYLYNIKQGAEAYSVYILDRRNWNNREIKNELKDRNFMPQTLVELNYILNKTLPKCPHVKEVVVSNFSYKDFVFDVQRKKAELCMMYKLVDNDGQTTIEEFLETYSNYYPRFFLFVKNLPHSTNISQEIKTKIENFLLNLRLNKKISSKSIIFTSGKSLEEILITIENILSNKNKYLSGHVYEL